MAEAPISGDVPTSSLPPAAPSDAALVAEALIKEGIELRKNGDDRGALAAFERALALDGSAQALAQLALAEQALGRWLDAHLHLTAALGRSSDVWIIAHRATLEAALEEIASRLGLLEIHCNVPGAEIQLDGRVVGYTPLGGPLRWVSGESVLRVSAPGYFDVSRQVKIDARGLARVDVTLTTAARADTPPESQAPSLRSSESELPQVGRAAGSEPVSAGRSSSTHDILAYASLGVAGLGMTLGVTGYVVREINAGAYNDDTRCDVLSGVPRSIECGDEARAVRTGEALSIAGFAAAGVFGLAAVWLWLERPGDTGKPQIACGLAGLVAGCSAQF